MQDQKTISIREYLQRRGIPFRESNGELITHCLFSGCDDDSRSTEAHLYFDIDTSQYHCKKCDATGNIFTLAKHLDESIENIALHPKRASNKPDKLRRKVDHNMVETFYQDMPDRIRQYLVARGVSEEAIEKYKIGYGNLYGRYWITIPVKDAKGRYQFLKLRKDPDDGTQGAKYMTYPSDSQATLYGADELGEWRDHIVICEGEFDSLILRSHGINAVTSTHGAMTFKEEWLEVLKSIRKVYVCFDNDEAGVKGAERLLKMLDGQNHVRREIYKVSLPPEVGEHGDVTDFVVHLQNDPQELLTTYASLYPPREPVDITDLAPLNLDELAEILGLTIKKDIANKLITFLAMLSAFTRSAQMNISYNSPSSSGKSYIPIEISQLFPADSVMMIGYASPTSFFHSSASYDPERDVYLVDLARMIIVFQDMPHEQLLGHLRPLLSHDTPEINVRITDKSDKGGQRTKEIVLLGYPSVVFCTASMQVDEQEATRFLLLSPETDQEKIREGIFAAVERESDLDAYVGWLEQNPARTLLKKRILAIRQEKVSDIRIANPSLIRELFFSNRTHLKPRHQRDIKKITSLIKAMALLNLWWRDRRGSSIIANDDDILNAFKLWDMISESQELSLPPYIYNFYREVLLPVWQEKNDSRNPSVAMVTGPMGIERREVLKKYFQVYSRPIAETLLRQQILPMLENVGLIWQESDGQDKRKRLIFVTEQNKETAQEPTKEETILEEEVEQFINLVEEAGL